MHRHQVVALRETGGRGELAERVVHIGQKTVEGIQVQLHAAAELLFEGGIVDDIDAVAQRDGQEGGNILAVDDAGAIELQGAGEVYIGRDARVVGDGDLEILQGII